MLQLNPATVTLQQTLPAASAMHQQQKQQQQGLHIQLQCSIHQHEVCG
jgi:hypothetical protein